MNLSRIGFMTITTKLSKNFIKKLINIINPSCLLLEIFPIQLNRLFALRDTSQAQPQTNNIFIRCLPLSTRANGQ
jgi:hypothetical protein